MNRVAQLRNIQNRALQLFKKKNADYGDAFATYGAVGVIVRMGDKISRLSSIDNSNITLVNDESMKDTLLDLHNYSAMALMLLEEEDEKKKNPERKKMWKPWVTQMSNPSELEQIKHNNKRSEKYNYMFVSDVMDNNDDVVERAKKVLNLMKSNNEK